MRLYGKVIETIPKERIIKIKYEDRMYYLYMTRKSFKDFGPYLFNLPYVFVEASEERRKIGKVFAYEIDNFYKIILPTKRERKVYYDVMNIRKGVKKVLNRIKYKMFLDLEFTLPAYYQSMPHIPEIVQFGFIIEDEKGSVVYEESSLVKPYRKYALNARTLSFLSRKRSEFDVACDYMYFYNVLKFCIKKYNPKIIAWGRADIMTLEQSFKTNKVKPIDINRRYINLMQVIKNYYNIREEMGLFQTYEDMSKTNIPPQIHDALEDAVLTKEIFRMFKTIVNDEVK